MRTEGSGKVGRNLGVETECGNTVDIVFLDNIDILSGMNGVEVGVIRAAVPCIGVHIGIETRIRSAPLPADNGLGLFLGGIVERAAMTAPVK